MSMKQTQDEKTGQKRGSFFSSLFSKSAEAKKDVPDRLEFWLKIAFLVVLVYFLVLDVYLIIKNTSWVKPGPRIEFVSETVFEQDVQEDSDRPHDERGVPESKAMRQILDGEVMIRQVDQPEQ